MVAVRDVLNRARVAVDVGRHLVRWHEPESKIVRDSQEYWEASPPERIGFRSHWRESFADEATWLAVGGESFALYEQFARSSGFARPARKVVEWGCGGGANAIHFAKGAEAFYGIELNRATLDECGRQMAAAGLSCFRPVLIRAEEPEAALKHVPRDCDLFTCLYVFEVFPTPEYGVRVLEIAHRMLRPGGMALVQIKYPTGLATRSRRWGYRFGMASMTTYRLHDFWEHATRVGFHVHAISLKPRQPLVRDGRYAYFALTKRAG